MDALEHFAEWIVAIFIATFIVMLLLLISRFVYFALLVVIISVFIKLLFSVL